MSIITFIIGAVVGILIHKFFFNKDKNGQNDKSLVATEKIKDDPVEAQPATKEDAAKWLRAFYAKDDDARREAVRALTNQALLADIAKNDEDVHVREAAISKLITPDQILLAEAAKKHLMASAAVEKLTDQALLAEVAKSYGNASDAVKKLTDQALLAEVAKNASNTHVGKAAVGKLSDQAFLADVARSCSDDEVRKAAIKKIKDLGRIQKVLSGEKDEEDGEEKAKEEEENS